MHNAQCIMEVEITQVCDKKNPAVKRDFLG